MVNRLFSPLLFALLPGHCLLCQSPSGQPRDLCSHCEAALPALGPHCQRCALPLQTAGAEAICGQCQRQPPTYDRCLCAWQYRSPADFLITDFKHHRRQASGRLLAELWLQSQRAQVAASPPDLLMPVPLHWRRRWQRGFNQSLILAESWGRALAIPVSRQLRRHRHTPPQQGLDARARQSNLRDAFRIAKAPQIDGKHIALIDDVMTTGATANTLAQLLRASGARQVDVWCLARTPSH